MIQVQVWLPEQRGYAPRGHAGWYDVGTPRDAAAAAELVERIVGLELRAVDVEPEADFGRESSDSRLKFQVKWNPDTNVIQRGGGS